MPFWRLVTEDWSRRLAYVNPPFSLMLETLGATAEQRIALADQLPGRWVLASGH